MNEPDLLTRLGRLLPGIPVTPDRIDEIPRAPGAYALLIRLAGPVSFARRAIGPAQLSGWLVYAGSARGPGGLRARLGRHFRPGKQVRWHVDELTNAAADLFALAIPGGSECAIVASLTQSGHFATALPGFGSSDCRVCRAHLLRPL